MTNIGTRAHYMPHTNSVYSYERYCGSCGQHIANINGSARFMPDTEDPWLDETVDFYDHDASIVYIKFCPWCGIALDIDLKASEVEGWRPEFHESDDDHRGDDHVFPELPVGHAISRRCHCSPTVEREVDRCVIKHNALVEAAP